MNQSGLKQGQRHLCSIANAIGSIMCIQAGGMRQQVMNRDVRFVGRHVIQVLADGIVDI